MEERGYRNISKPWPVPIFDTCGGEAVTQTLSCRNSGEKSALLGQPEYEDRDRFSKTSCEPVFQRKVWDVLKMTGIMRHERRTMVFRDGRNQGIFFSRRPAHAQQLCAEGPVDSRGFPVKRNDFDACHEFG